MTDYRSFKRTSLRRNYSIKTTLKLGVIAIASLAIYESCQIKKELNELQENNYHITNSNLENILNNYE